MNKTVILVGCDSASDAHDRMKKTSELLYINDIENVFASSFGNTYKPRTHICDVWYIKQDVEATSFLYKQLNMPQDKLPEIKNVIFNDPATIVMWADGTKTVVQCQEGDIYDPEKGLAMAISKKILGNKHDYYHTFKHWLKKYKKEDK